MSSFRDTGAALALALSILASPAQAGGEAAGQKAGGEAAYAGIGRAATPGEVAAWDIDVRPDFKGLPAGAGSVARGQEVWEGKCASCHGVFGESNEVFSPLVGGTSAQDILSGHVANLRRPDYPGRTTLMKLSTLSTLWDYINRAMPWNQPKSLTTTEVYAVTAYLLNLGGVVPADFTLSDQNIRQVQQRLPNRNGATTQHALWPGREFGGAGRPDVAARACMKDCASGSPTVASALPAFARDAHGNLAAQNRLVGPQRGADTTRPEAVSATAAPAAASGDASTVQALAQKNHCTACHTVDRKLVGPSWSDIARKYEGKDPGQADYLAGKIKSGGAGAWGTIPMPAQSLSDADARRIASWLAAGAAR